MCEKYRTLSNTRIWQEVESARAVHPHARGEHGKTPRQRGLIIGSSPRPWGTPLVINVDSEPDRFIPTPVGNTAPRHAPVNARAVHPHARGEHRRWRRMALRTPGSSPRPWGTPLMSSSFPVPARFIPTPVGNTLRTRGASTPVSVHPHARGEHGKAAFCTQAGSGSSPRPWGTLPLDTPVANEARFIPTPVGNTLSRGTKPL